ncbi:uncharacterized protein RBU33_017152 isoform 1-T1 [Hipposideros larvatus]
MEPEHFPPSGQAPRLGTRPRGGRGRRPSLPGALRAVARLLFLRSRLVLTPLLPRPGREGAAGGGGSFLGGAGGQTGWRSDCGRRRSKEREDIVIANPRDRKLGLRSSHLVTMRKRRGELPRQ